MKQLGDSDHQENTRGSGRRLRVLSNLFTARWPLQGSERGGQGQYPNSASSSLPRSRTSGRLRRHAEHAARLGVTTIVAKNAAVARVHAAKPAARRMHGRACREQVDSLTLAGSAWRSLLEGTFPLRVPGGLVQPRSAAGRRKDGPAPSDASTARHAHEGPRTTLRARQLGAARRSPPPIRHDVACDSRAGEKRLHAPGIAS